MRIKNLWRIKNNYSRDVWVWVFQTDATEYIFPIEGKLFQLLAREETEIEIKEGTVQIGFREGNTIFSEWVAKPVFVQTDRDISLTEKKKISFPKHGMYDSASKTKDTYFISPAQSNNMARSLITSLLGKIPTVGGVVSGIVGFIWKEEKPKIEHLIKQSEQRMRSWVHGQINELKRDDLDKMSKGLINNLNEYMTAKTPKTRLDWLRINIAHFYDKMPYFTDNKYIAGTVAIGVDMATLHIGLLRERVLFAEELGISEIERAGNIKKLEELIDVYKSYVLNIASPQELAWRIDEENQLKSTIVGKNLYYIHDSVTRQAYCYADIQRGYSRNTSNSIVNRNYYLRQAESSYHNALITNIEDTARLWTLLKVTPETLQPISMDKLSWVGPCSGLIYKEGNGHGAVETKKLNTHGNIKTIIIRAAKEVDYFKVIYQDGKSHAVGNPKGGKEYQITLKEGVYITKVETWWDWELMAIKFHMSDGTHSEKLGGENRKDENRKGEYLQTAVMENRILSGIQIEGKKEASIGNGMSFGFILRPDFYELDS